MTMEAYYGSRYRETPVLIHDGSQWGDSPLYLHDGSYWIKQKTRPQVGVSRWTFDNADTDGSTVVDAWNTNDGTINGATTGVSGANQTYDTGEAYDFDGTDDNITFTNSPTDGQSAITISAWVKIDDKSTYNTVASSRTSDSGFELNQRGDLGGKLKFTLFNSGGSGGVATNFVPNEGEWYHLVGTADSNGSEFYVDGSSVGTANVGLTTNNLMEIGRSTAFTEGFFDGKIDDVRIYDKTLTDDEANRLYHLGNINYPPASAISRWSFDDSATDSGTALDVWNGNDGTINGATTGVSGANQTYNTAEAYDFDGSDDYIDLPTGLDGTYQTLSVFIWMKTDTLTKNFQGLLSSDTYDEGNVHFQLNYDELQFAQSGGAGVKTGGTIINKDQWHHVGYTFDINGDVSLYIDGGKIGSSTAAEDVVLKNLVIGRSNGSSRYFDGTLDDPRVFDKTLTDTEVERLYNVGAI